MELVKETAEYKVYKKKSNRYAVRGADRAWIRGDEKTNILLKEKLIKTGLPKPKKEKAGESAAAE